MLTEFVILSMMFTSYLWCITWIIELLLKSNWMALLHFTWGSCNSEPYIRCRHQVLNLSWIRKGDWNIQNILRDKTYTVTLLCWYLQNKVLWLWSSSVLKIILHHRQGKNCIPRIFCTMHAAVQQYEELKSSWLCMADKEEITSIHGL